MGKSPNTSISSHRPLITLNLDMPRAYMCCGEWVLGAYPALSLFPLTIE